MSDDKSRLKTITHDLKHCYHTMHPAFKAKRLEEYKELTGKDWEDDK